MACCKEEGLVRQLFLQMNWITSRFVGIIYQPKKQLNRSVSVMQNQTKCERSMQEVISISRNCTYNEIIVVNHLASC